MNTLNLADIGRHSQSEGSHESGLRRISFGSSKSTNPQFEKFRKNLKGQLFTREDSNGSNSTQHQSHQQSDNTPTSTTSSMPFYNKQKISESVSPHHSRLDKIRNSVKGNLLLLSHKSASISPANHTHQKANTFGDIGELKPFSLSLMNCMLDESPKSGEESSPLPPQSMIHEIEELTGDILEELDDNKLDSPGNNGSLKFLPIQRQNIFFDVGESEIQDIKEQFGLDDKSKITFFKGDFSTYYREDDILGEGTSGVVKKCFKVGTDEPFAVKIVQYKGDLEILGLIIKEFLNLKALDHKNVIKVYELYVDYFKKKIYSIMELAECCEMFDVMKDLGHYSEAVASGIFKQILTGISYLHMHGVCHRDLKPNNILVSKDGKIVKITDFNVSKFLEKTEEKQKFSSLSSENYKMWTNTGTIAFTAPEVFLENEYTERVDIWSAGVVLYIMLCGYQPFQADYVKDLIELIKEGKYEFHKDQWEHISEQAKDLVKHCLDVNPKTRYTPFDALMHPWVANQGKVSDVTMSNVKENFRVYYKKCTSNKKNLASAVQIKKIQVNSPSLHVASPYACRLRKRSGTLRPLQPYLNKNKLSPRLPARDKENKNMELNGRMRFREITSINDASTKDITDNEKPEPEPESEPTAEINQPPTIEIIEGYDSPTDDEEREFTGRDSQVKKLSWKEKMEDETAKLSKLCIRESDDEDTITPKNSQVPSWDQYYN